MYCSIMKTIKNLTKKLVKGYIKGFKETANMTYRHLYY